MPEAWPAEFDGEIMAMLFQLATDKLHAEEQVRALQAHTLALETELGGVAREAAVLEQVREVLRGE